MALIFGTSNRQRSAEISRQVKAGRLRKLASKLYTDDLSTLTPPAADAAEKQIPISHYVFRHGLLERRLYR